MSRGEGKVNPYESPRHPAQTGGPPSPLALWLLDRLMLVGTAIIVFSVVMGIALLWAALTGQLHKR